MSKQVTVVIVGAGNRADIYASYSLTHPDKLKVVGIVDPDKIRRGIMQKKYDVDDDRCFDSVEEFVKVDKFADAVINGTMDHLHVSTSIPMLEKGYDMLLEKPFALNEEEMDKLVDVANKNNSKVYICHVLRYAPFFKAIKQHLINKEIGDILTIETCEHVNYHHMAVAFVRGKWRSEKLCFAPMILAKSCHDMDIMMWMMNETEPVSVASFGNNMQFIPEKKPSDAGERCMVDCPRNKECPFSAEANYISEPRWIQYVWKCIEGDLDQSVENKIKSLKEFNPYGKCVWDFERDGNVDHQAVLVNFKNGATGAFTMVGGTSKSERNIHIVGTKGEIKGTFEDSIYVLRKISPYTKDGYETTTYDLKITGDMTGQTGAHGGGDVGLIADFVAVMSGEEPSISCTDINDSTLSHRVIFRAEKSRKNKTIEAID